MDFHKWILYTPRHHDIREFYLTSRFKQVYLFIHAWIVVHRVLKVKHILKVMEVLCELAPKSQILHFPSSIIEGHGSQRLPWLNCSVILRVFVLIQNLCLHLAFPMLTLNKYIALPYNPRSNCAYLTQMRCFDPFSRIYRLVCLRLENFSPKFWAYSLSTGVPWWLGKRRV